MLERIQDAFAESGEIGTCVSEAITAGRSIHPAQHFDIMAANRFIGRRLTIGLGLLLLLVTHHAAAQTASIQGMFTGGGEQPDRGLIDGLPFERIDPMTGNVVLSFDDVVLPGNAGKSLNFTRHYNSSVNAWSFGVAGIPLSIEDNGDPTLPDMLDIAQRTPTFAMADGGVRKGHYVYLSVIGPQRFRWVVTTENWLYDRQAKVLYLPDGTRAFYFEELSGLRLIEVRDVYGNVTTFSAFIGDRQVITQRLGNDQSRELEVFRDPTTRNVSKVTSEGREWNYVWDPVRRERLLRADMPAGPDWVFSYGTNELTVRAPGGGTVKYTFTEHVWYTTGEVSGPTFSFFPVTTREMLSAANVTPGVWTYRYNMTATGGISTQTEIDGPDNVRTTYTHKMLASGIDPKWAVTNRTVATVNGATAVEHERETFVYDITRGPWLQSDFAATRLRQKTIVRGGQSYVTDYQFRTTGPVSAIDYLSPSLITETGPPAGAEPGLVRTTARTYDFALGPNPEFGLVGYLTGFLKSETVTIGAESHVTTYDRDQGTGFITSITTDGVISTFTKNGQGNVATEKNARDHESTYTYAWGVRSGEASSVASVTREVASDSTVTSEKRRGVGPVDPGADDREYTTSFTYDALSRLKSLTPPIGNTVTTTYDDDAGSFMTRQRGSMRLTTYYDGFGRVIGTRNVNGIATRITYDANGRATYRSHPYDGGSSSGLPALPAIRVGKTTTYDALGRPLSEAEPGTPRPSRVEYAQDTVRAYDENAHRTELEYRAFGDPDDRRLVRVNDPDGKDWTYTYNTLGTLTRVTAPDGLTRTWSFDSRGWNNGTTMPESGTTVLTHDAVGNVQSKTDARQTVSSFTYDAHNRPVEISVTRAGASAAETTSIRYQRGSETRRRTSNAHVTTEYSFDLGGRPIERRDTIGGRMPLVTHYEYDGNDNLKSVRYPSGRLVEYTYDSGNRATAVSETTRSGRTVRHAYDVEYHPSGAVKSYKTGNGITHTITYDENRYWTKTIRSGPLSLDYQFDPVGNINVITDPRAGMSQAFAYDSQDRLTSAHGGGTPPTSAWYGSIAYAYDAHGNRKTIPGNTEYTYWPNTLRLKSQGNSQFAYDGNGNLLTAPYRTYTYDAENMIETASGDGRSSTYRYDADGLRKERTINGATTLFVHGLGTKLLTELAAPASGPITVAREYIYLGGRLIASIVPPDGAQPLGQTVRLVRPLPFAEYEAALSITIEAQPFTSEGTTTKVEFFADGGKVGEKASAPWTFVWTPATPATYQLTAKATNSLNQTVTSAPVPVIVKAPQPTVVWTAVAQTVEEPANPATACSAAAARPLAAELMLHLPSGSLAQEITVVYSVTGGSYLEAFASEGRDYSAPSAQARSVTFPAGTLTNARRTVDLGILHDCKDEADETFELRIERIIGGDGTVVIGPTRTQVVTIVDNDEPPTVNLSPDVTINEAAGQVTLTVSLSAASGRLVAVNASTILPAGLCDFFTNKQERLTFAEDETQKAFTVALTNNTKGNEPPKSFYVDLGAPEHAVIGRGRATITVLDEVSDALTALNWPGTFLANVHASGRRDYVLITNPFNRTVQATITTVFDSGAAMRHTQTLTPFARYTLRLDLLETNCEAGTSIAVQVPTEADLLGVEHAGYIPPASGQPSEGGVSSEGVKRAANWYFAEGHTGFGRELLDVFNPTAVPVIVRGTMYGPDGLLPAEPIVLSLPALSRRQIALNGLYLSSEHGLIVRATPADGVSPAEIVATRTVMADPQYVWRDTADGHASSGVSAPAASAFLAEGHKGSALRTYLLLQNTQLIQSTVTVRYIHENGSVYNVQYPFKPLARLTIEPPPELPGGGFGYHITTNPAVLFVAERAVYTNPTSKAGHLGVAAPRPSGVRAFSEGATGPLETWFLVTNPSETQSATVLFEFFDETGTHYRRPDELIVPPRSRAQLNVSNLPEMRQSIFHTVVSSTVPVVTERVSYWPTRAVSGLVGGLLLPFAPSATLLAVARDWTPDPGVPTTPYPYTPVPYTLVGPEWAPAALAAAAQNPAPGLRVKTFFASGDAWLGAHASGGWEVSAEARVATVKLETLTSAVTEGATASVQVRLTTANGGPLMRAVAVTYRVTAGVGTFPATPGSDFSVTTSGTLTFNEGEGGGTGVVRTITIPTVQDTVSEYSETFKVEITGITGLGVFAPDRTHTVTIHDNDPFPSFSVTSVERVEGQGPAQFKVRLSQASEMATAVTAMTTDGTAKAGLDYTARFLEVSMPPGMTEMDFSVNLLDDDLVEPTERFYVDLSSPVHATIAVPRGTGTILDNEPPRAEIDLSLPTLLVPDADTSSAPGFSDYIVIYNPHDVAVTARVIYTKQDGSGVTQLHPMTARGRLAIRPSTIGSVGEVSVAVQATVPGFPLVVDHSQYWGASGEAGTSTRGTSPAATWYFAEGAFNDYFEEYLTIYNPTNDPVIISATLYPEGGGIPKILSWPINTGPGRLKVRLNSLPYPLTHGTIVTARRQSDSMGSPIAVERAMIWAGGDRREGSRSSGSASLSNSWTFAEGAKGTYSTYLTLMNSSPSGGNVNVSWIGESGTVVTQPVYLAPVSRLTIEPPASVPSGAFGIQVDSPTMAIVAERSVYAGTNWELGDSDVGAPSRALRWRFAEGATGSFFDTFLMLVNPSATAANVTVTYRKDTGAVTTQTITIPATSRYTIAVDTVAGMGTAVFATDVDVTNGVPIVAERVMYWPDGAWAGSHVALGRPW